jgi:hypothetical protein
MVFFLYIVNQGEFSLWEDIVASKTKKSTS